MIYPRTSPILASRVGKPIPTALAAWYRYNTGITSSGGTVSAWANQVSGGEALVQATAANQPQFLTYSGTKYMNLTGRAGTYASTPDAAALDITGDISFLAYVAADDWTPGDVTAIISKWSFSDPNRSYRLLLLANGTIQIANTTDGTSGTLVTTTSSVAPSVSNGSPLYILATLDVSDGSGNRVGRFYTSTDGVVFTALGTVQTVAGNTSIHSSATNLLVGASDVGIANLLAGKVFQSQVWNGLLTVDGNGALVTTGATKVFDADFSAQAENATSFAESANGATVTLNGSAQLIGATSANTLLFNGVDSFLKTAPFTLNQPTTVYFLGRQVTWTNNDRFFDGNTTNTLGIQQVGSSPQIRLRNSSGGSLNGNLVVGEYAIVTGLFNGASSYSKVNNTADVVANSGTDAAGGFTLGSNGAGNAEYGNIQCKEVLIYSVAHDANQRAAVIAYLNMVNQL